MSMPGFFDQAPVVCVRDRLADLLGAAGDGVMEYHYADAVRLAGHSCPTVAGAYLLGRTALMTLYPGEIPERGGVSVRMPAPVDDGVTGVTAQVLTLLTGAAAENGFHGLGGQYVRSGLLDFAESVEGGPILFRRNDTGAAVALTLDLSSVPPDPAQRALLGPVLQGNADAAQQRAFGVAWQGRVRRLLLEHADDPAVIRVERR
ncbi:hypothetical protein [Rhodanobacter glycinis]|uniref:Formylmethanofuran dehydrogenase subunit E domain-containing protein n=1 Tax=Rhodanobacter glycinis TaxID=582702 RepID=A0A1I4EH47_9GAMM|nr:hypothetical protein [Rhodanobacter glycinis]SFL03917.1 hypothetical protein SAMN05192579_11241 [Rhodanobacter glycinis]